MNPWLAHVKKVYEEMKKKNSKAQYKDAIKEAKKTYKRLTAWQKETWYETH